MTLQSQSMAAFFASTGSRQSVLHLLGRVSFILLKDCLQVTAQFQCVDSRTGDKGSCQVQQFMRLLRLLYMPREPRLWEPEARAGPTAAAG